jgi:hypothetical protein
MAGRALCRLPVLALARYIRMGCVAGFQPHSGATEPSQVAPIEVWLEGLELAVNDIAKEKDIIM